MLITLDVEDCRSGRFSRRLRSLFRPYELNARIKKQSKISVLQLRYKKYRGRIRFKKIYPYTIGCSKTILCSKDTDLSDTPFERFESNELTQKLMTNYVCGLLEHINESSGEIRTAYYDPDGEHPMIAQELLRHVPELTVVTNTPRFYEREADRLMDEYGMSLIVSNTIDALTDCQLLVSSTAVDITLPLPLDAVVFAPEPPSVSLRNTVIHSYEVVVPYKYRRLKPDGMDDIYFLSALYSLCGVKEAEDIIPVQCSDGDGIFTSERILHRLCTREKSA